MAAGKRYSAGRIFLEVVPSFKGLQDDIQRHVGRMNRDLEDQAEQDGKKVAEARERGAEKVEREAAAARKRRAAQSAKEEADAQGRYLDPILKNLRAQKNRSAEQEIADQRKYAQMMTRERAKASQQQTRDEARAADERQKQLQRELSDFQRHTQAMFDARLKESARAEKEQRDAASAKARLAEQVRQQEAKDTAAREKMQRDHMAWVIRTTFEENKRIADLEKKAADDRMREEERAEARAEAARRKIRQRRIQSRLAEMRRGDNERARLAGGAAGDTVRKVTQSAADAIGVMKLDVDSSDAKREIATIREELLRINGSVGVDLDAGEAMARLTDINARLAKLRKESPEIDVDVNIAAAMASLKRIEQQQDQINRKRVTGGLFAGAMGQADQGANSFRIFNYRVLGLITLLPALPPLLAVSAAGIAAIGTAAIGAGAGLGVMFLGFQGIGDAISALNEVQSTQAKRTEDNAKAMRTAAKTVRDAQQGLQRAQRDAANDARDSARSIADAEQKLTDARQNAARAQASAARRISDAERNLAQTRKSVAQQAVDAAQRVEDARRSLVDTEARSAKQIQSALRTQADAEKRLADSQRNATQAQQDLRDARLQAQKDQEALADRIKGGKLDERQALIDLFNAQVEYNAAIADGGATNLDKEQASIQLERAQLAIKGIREENARLAEEQKKGVDQSDGVLTAQQRLKDAQEQVAGARTDAAEAAAAVGDARRQAAEDEADARQNVKDAVDEQVQQQLDGAQRISDAELNLSDARVDAAQQQRDSARSIADAQRGIADAEEAAARSAISSREGVRDAQERLTDAQAAYQEALTKTGEAGDEAMRKLKEAMGGLSPAGQDFARFIFGLKGFYDDLRFAAQEGMLPGVQQMISSLVDTYGPRLKDFVKVMSRTIGDFAISFGRAMESPEMQAFFDTMAEYAPTFFTQFGDLGIAFIKIIAGVARAFAPFAKEFMDGFVNLAEGWADWANGLADNPAFQAFLDYVRAEGPVVLELLGDLLKLVINIGIGLAESGVFDMLAGLIGFLADLDPQVIAGIVGSILALAAASQIAAGINSLIITLGFLATSTVGVVVLAIGALVVAFVTLYNSNETFRKGVDAVWAWIQGVIEGFVDWWQGSFMPWWSDTALPALKAVWDAIAAGATWLWETMLQPIFTGLMTVVGVVFTFIAWAWEHGLKPVITAIGIFIAWTWNNVIWPVLKIFGEAIAAVFQIFADLYNYRFKPIFEAFGRKFKEVWDTWIYPFFDKVGGGWSKLWENYIRPVLGWIGDNVSLIFKGIGIAWDKVLKPILNAVATAIRGDFYTAWVEVVGAIGTLWSGLRDLLATPINWVIDTVLNNGLFKAFDKIMEFFGSDVRAPKLSTIRVTDDNYKSTTPLAFKGSQGNLGKSKLQGFDVGGYTGPGHRLQPAGIVHAGEVVWSQDDIRRWGGVNVVEAMRTAPGYALGGMVRPVPQGPRFPWGRYPSGARHPALDLPTPMGTPVRAPYPATVLRDGWDSTGYGTSIRTANEGGGAGTYTIFGHLMRELVSVGQKISAGQLIGYTGNSGNSSGPHLHLEFRTSPFSQSSAFDFTRAFNGGNSMFSAVAAAAGAPAQAELPWWADKPLQLLRDTASNLMPKMPGAGIFGSMLKAFPFKIIDGARDFIARIVGGDSNGDLDKVSGQGGQRSGFTFNGIELPDNGTMMYDNGGYVQPGVTQLLNLTGRPEPVRTAEQEDNLGRVRGGALVDHLEIKVGSDGQAKDALDEAFYVLRKIDHGGKYATMGRP